MNVPLAQRGLRMAFKLNANRRIGLALLWLALLAVAGFWLSETLKVTGDLRKFMPARSNAKGARTAPCRARGWWTFRWHSEACAWRLS
ncbi:hypothetical protein [Xanthomonas arboricola]|uniref:hypothetical protein n=1 Tax=Xanthomonas arboricola TaxID=56448 RepID=UPI0035E693F0